MNVFYETLAQICQIRRLDEKWLLAPNLRIGQQWLDRVAFSGIPVVNARPKTLRRLAFDLAEPELRRRNLRRLEPLAGPLIVERIWKQTANPKGGYLGTLTPSAGLFASLYHSLMALRLAGLTSVNPACFETTGKGKEIPRLLQEYQTFCQRHSLADDAEILRLARDGIRQSPSWFPARVFLLVPDDLELWGLERELIEAVPAGQIVRLPVEQPARDGVPMPNPQSDLDRLRWFPTPAEAPPPRQDGSVKIQHAIGEVNEIRAILRQCLVEKIPFDQVELIHTDAETYVPLIYELCERHGIPVTFADGIPTRYSRPGRALKGWLRWIGEDFPQSVLVSMIQDGLLQLPLREVDMDEYGFARLFQYLPIGFGRDRYETKIHEAIQALEIRLAHPERLRNEAMEEDRELPDGSRLEKRKNDLFILKQFISELLEITPGADASGDEILESAVRFLNTSARAVTEIDRYARQRLSETIQPLRIWLPLAGDRPVLNTRTWLALLPDTVWVMAQMPQGGHLHVASLHNGGHSGRPYTFLAGFDDSRFPGGGRQDPILLDLERERLSPEIPTAAARLHQKLESFYRLVCRLEGRVVFSFASYDILNDREMFPSPVVLAAYRILSGEAEGNQTTLMKWLPPPASFAPAALDAALDENDCWMAALQQRQEDRLSLSAAGERFPHLAQGGAAREARLGQVFTEFDGCVPEAGIHLSPTGAEAKPLSASMLETLGQCPLRFFFRHGLQIRPPEILEMDPERWLDPLAFGSLLHTLFERFASELIETHQRPTFNTHWPRMRELLAPLVEEYRQLIPPPNESAFKRQLDQLERAALVFLKEEEQQAGAYTPVYLEAALGMPNPGRPTDLDTPDPVPVMLRDGVRILTRGKVDRVDRIQGQEPDAYAIWDYKTGSSKKYQPSDPFNQGRVIQHALYLEMVSQRLRKEMAKDARVAQFGYFFPNVKERGERRLWTPEELKEMGNVLFDLCELISTGTFLPTDNSDDCAFCDYKEICGDVEAAAAASKQKLENPENTRLHPFRKLRRYDSSS
ncbi:MAG TPA: PD-(D/E)XK nuclease family protein [bacterium]|nr:PD-(D/E)XK nuclease family protein [bacterium]